MSARKKYLHLIYNVTGDLWCKHRKIVGCEDEKDTGKKPVPVPDEIFIENGKMFQIMCLASKISV